MDKSTNIPLKSVFEIDQKNSRKENAKKAIKRM